MYKLVKSSVHVQTGELYWSAPTDVTDKWRAYSDKRLQLPQHLTI